MRRVGVRVVLAGVLIATGLPAQREGPLRVPAPRSVAAPPCPEGTTRSPSSGECVWKEVVVSPEGTVLEEIVHPPGSDPLLARVAGEVQRFTQELPDFLCEQLTWRFDSDSRPPRWRLRDRISAEVLYLNGREIYQNLRRNGRPVEYRHAERTGTWSTGEFGTLVRDLFFPATAARFRFLKDTELNGQPARLYEFEVPQEGSHWRVDFEGHVLYPAYRGSLWVHPETARVLRIEMEARQVPSSYPMDVIEMTVDYGPVLIGGAWYLLPVRAENLACKRYSTYCTYNEITFTHYRRFVAESVLTTSDSKITYELPGEPPHGAPEP